MALSVLGNANVPGFRKGSPVLGLPGKPAIALINICLFSKFYADWVRGCLEEVGKEVVPVKFPL